jgi:type IV pilus assembly protein PilM
VAPPPGPPTAAPGPPSGPPPAVPPASPSGQPPTQPVTGAAQPAAPAPPAAPSPLETLRASVSKDVIEKPPEKKVPFYKREISFGGKKKKEQKASVTETAAAAAPAAAAEAEKKVPFYKREISLGGKKKKEQKAAAVEAVAAAEAVTPAAGAEVPPAIPAAPVEPVAAPVIAPTAKPEKKVPFYKREISFGGKKKKEKKTSATETAAAAAPVVAAEVASAETADVPAAVTAEPVAAAVAAPAKKVPFYKRDLSFGHKGPSAPAPKGSALRQKALVGVKIGASGISVARVMRTGNKLELLDLVHEPLQRGVVVAGEVRDTQALATALANLFTTHHLPKKAVRLGISNNRIGVRIIEVSGVMDAKQLENAIRFRAQEVLPIALEDAVLDYQQLSESVNADGELIRRILLVVAYRDLIDRYVVAFKDAGVRLVGIDLEAFGLLRALIPEHAEGRADAAHVVVSIGHERSTFAVSDGRICEFTRVLDWGGSTLDVAIARQLNLAPSEAEPVKFSLTLDGSERPLLAGVTQEQVATAADIVRRQLQTFARELVSSLQYYQNQPDSLGIGDIVITGGTSILPGLASELQRLIGVSVRVGDPFERVKPSKDVVVDESQRALAAAIGLAIED